VLPSVDGAIVGRRSGAELDAIEREAWDKGFGAGREAGITAARREQQTQLDQAAQRVQRLGEILDYMARPITELDEEVQRQLALLAVAIARQLVRRELKTNPDEVVAVVRETIALLPMSAREVRVHLHPEDAKLVRERLSEVSAERLWSIAEDPLLSRGGCRVTSENSSVDAQLDKRLGAAVVAMLGDERSVTAAP
jgi:flagellar assembly protein FliH